MTSDTDAVAHPDHATEGPVRHPQVHAARVPTPSACGCGRPVAFDIDDHEFFCIGCGLTKACTCRRTRLTAAARPTNVV